MFNVISFFIDSPRPFAKYSAPDMKYLGAFYFTKNEYVPIHTKHKIKYKGNLIVLVDKRTLSHLEFFTMALQTYEKCFVFGSQTAGADGNMSELFLPGNIKTTFTGLGVFYPDGTGTQRKGLRIDYSYMPTYEEDVKNDDAVLNKLIQLIYENPQSVNDFYIEHRH